MNNILHIDASARGATSVSRKLSSQLAQQLRTDIGSITYRDVSQGLPFVDEVMISAYYTPAADRTEQQQQAIELSNEIVDELKTNDTLVIGMPIYNFSMPAGFKAWSDLAARVDETFRYTEDGPVGLLEGKKAYVVVVSGGTKVASEIDFLTPWLRHYLGFIGISDVEFVQADVLNNSNAEQTIERARSFIEAVNV
ncbi:MAG: FMN-dependent NADH-azoreductase [Polaribacter sp.]|jgi:FMN-dependent NADH-azoreductase